MGGKKIQALEVIGDKEIKLAGKFGEESKWSLKTEKEYKGGLHIELTGGENCENGQNQNYSIVYDLECDENIEKFKNIDINNIKVKKNGCQSIVQFALKGACPSVETYKVWEFLKENKGILAAILMIFGLFEMFLGNYLVKVTAFLITIAIIIVIIFNLVFNFLGDIKHKNVIQWIIIGVGVLVGLVIGFFVAKYSDKVLGFIVGILMGFILAAFLYDLVFYKISWHPVVIQWILVIICIIIMVVVSIFLFDFVMIISTSFIGSYCFIRGISLLAGGFPDESIVKDLIEKKEKEQLKEILTWKVYLYLAAIVIGFIAGIAVQYIIKNKTKNKDGSKSSKLVS